MKKRQLIGILNCTPDSYFSGGRFTVHEEAIEYGLRLFEEGADIVDIGGESTRPGSEVAVSAKEEIKRILPVIKGIRKKTNKTLSVDTFKPQVAQAALDAGVDWINDITGLGNPDMQRLVRDTKAFCCVMHAYGPPHTLPQPMYARGVVEEILIFFRERLSQLLQLGIEPSKIILDPGIGGGSFGKNIDENLAILQNTQRFAQLGHPILISLSRKSFLQKILQKPPSELLSTTLALNTMALLEGASFIRVHDVAEHHDILRVLDRMETLQHGFFTHPDPHQ
jgi:dihydropteroate synthase